MPRLARPTLAFAALVAVFAAPALHAQTTATDARPDLPAPKSADDSKPRRARAVSGDLAASLSAAMPKYNPPPKPPEKKPDEDDIDLRDVDKPKNQIVRLPKMYVQDKKPPVFSQRELATAKGGADLAMARHGGLGLGNFFGLNRGIAQFMYEEDQRLQTISEYKDMSKDARRSGDKAASDYISRKTNETFMRTYDYGRVDK